LNKKRYVSNFKPTHFQVLALFAASDVEWPTEILDLFRFFSIFNFNIDITAPECVYPDISYRQKWWAIMAIPFGVALVLLMANFYVSTFSFHPLTLVLNLIFYTTTAQLQKIVSKCLQGRRHDMWKHTHLLVKLWGNFAFLRPKTA
jgi:hypothetical protein